MRTTGRDTLEGTTTGGDVGALARFGRDILESLAADLMPLTTDDAGWAEWAFADADADREFDRRADESACLDRYTNGWLL